MLKKFSEKLNCFTHVTLHIKHIIQYVVILKLRDSKI